MNLQGDLDYLHECLIKAKTLEKLSFKRLGESIGYSNEGMNKAIKNKTLSIIQIEKVIKDFNLHDYFDKNESISEINDIVKNGNDFQITSKLMMLFEKAVLFKEEELLKSNIITTWLENKKLAVENKLLREIASKKNK